MTLIQKVGNGGVSLVAERSLHQILVRYPHLIEFGLVLLRSEAPPTEGHRHRRVDLLFLDASGQRLLVELKRGALKDKDVGQLLRYAGELLRGEDHLEPRLRKMLVGTSVARNLRAGLEHSGIECKILDLDQIRIFLLGQCEQELVAELSTDEELPTRTRATGHVCVRVGEQVLGPTSFSEVMLHLYQNLLTIFGIQPEDLVQCSNPGGYKRK